MSENEDKNNEVKEKETGNGSTLAGTAIGTALGTFIAPGLGSVIGGALGGFVGSLFNSDSKEKSEIEKKKKVFDSIEKLLEPIYNGDFTTVFLSIVDYKKEEARAVENSEAYVDRRFLDNAEIFLNYYRKNKNLLPPKDSEYDKALKNWRIFEEYKTAKEYFIKSIQKEEITRNIAVCDYIDFVSQTESRGQAIKELEKYIKLYGEQTEFIKKAVSIYSQQNNIKKVYVNLLILTNDKSYPQEKTGELLLRLSECEYKLGNFEKSIETAKKAFECGCWLFGYANQIVESYIALKEYDNARNFVDEIEAKFGDELKQTEKLESYEIYLYNLPFYFRDRINAAERSKENNNKSTLDNDKFVQKCLINTPVNEYELAALLKREGNIYEYRYLNEYPSFMHAFPLVDDTVIDIFYLEQLYAECFSLAYVIKHLYGKTEKYYQYLSEGLFLYAISSHEWNNLNDMTDLSYMLCAFKTGFMIKENSTLEYLIETVYQSNFFSSSNTLDMLNLKSLIVIVKMNAYSGNYTKNITNLECQLLKYSPVLRSNLSSEDERYVIEEVDKRFDSAEQKFKCWLEAVRKNVNFKENLRNLADEVRKSVLVLKSDEKFIDDYINCVARMDEFYKYDDFDNRMSIISQVFNELGKLEPKKENSKAEKYLVQKWIPAKKNNFEKDSSKTIFFENYLGEIIAATKNNLQKLITRTRKDFATKITLEIPNTNVVPDESGNVTLSIRIANAENRAPAKNMKLSVENTAGQEIFLKDLSEKNLIGGASVSELIMIPTESKDAFDVKIIVCYDSGSVEKSVQITVDSGKFEEIRNPYNTGNPVEKDDMFFGRDELIERLAKSLKDDTTRCVIIYGQKRSGKSSIFKHLRGKLEDKFVVLSFSTGLDITSEKKFYNCVRDEFSEYLEDNRFDDDIIEKFENFDVSDLLSFQRFVRKANREVCKPQNKELLLMIDEFTALYEYMKNPDYSLGKENFMDKWKAMSEQNLFKSALIGQDNMPEFIRAYPNQFQVTELIRVSYLEKEYAVKLITEPIRSKDGNSRFLHGAENKIEDWFNGQPYYIQTYCKKLVDYLNFKKDKSSITMAVAEKVKKLMLDDSKIDFYDNLVGKDDTTAWNVLKKIASSDVEDVPVDISSLSEDEKNALDKLTDREVLTKKQDRYTIKIPFFREWIREYK